MSWQLALYPALIGLPLLITVLLSGKASRGSERRWQAFLAEMASLGLPVRPGASQSAWQADGLIDRLPIAVERFTVKQGKSTHSRIAIRVTAPTSLADAAVYATGAVPVGALGAMQELPSEPAFAAKYRAFAAQAHEAPRWLTAQARAALVALGCVRELTVKSGALVLVLDGAVSSGRALSCAAELAAAVHAARAPRLSGEIGPVAIGFASPWAKPAYLPILLGFILGILLPIIPGVAPLASPLVCERGRLEMVWSSSGRGKSAGNLRCVDAADRFDSKCVLPFLIFFNGVYLPFTLLFSVGAARRALTAPRGSA